MLTDLQEHPITDTDETACGRCGRPTTFGGSAPWGAGGRICPACVSRAADDRLLARAAGPASR